MGGITWETSMWDKEAIECWEFFRNALLEAQNQFILFKGRGSRQSERPTCLNSELPVLLKCKEMPTRNGKADENLLKTTGALPECADAIRKAVSNWNWPEILKLYQSSSNQKAETEEKYCLAIKQERWIKSPTVLKRQEILNPLFTSVLLLGRSRLWGKKTDQCKHRLTIS